MTHHKLVIAEKPSVAQSIAAVLGATKRNDGYLSGNGYLVSWCFGHLAELAGADVYDEKYAKWRYDDLPILPASWRFTLKADKAKQFELLRDLMRREDVTEVINACDAGREGELIFRTVYYMAGCTKTMKRLWISSISLVRRSVSWWRSAMSSVLMLWVMNRSSIRWVRAMVLWAMSTKS